LKYFFLLIFSFCNLFLTNISIKAAERVNIKFEEMEIPLTIEQLSKLETYKDNSTELIDWLSKYKFIKYLELSKFLKFPVFKDQGLNRELLRSWVGRKILSELSKTIIVPDDNDGIEVFNTIEKLLEDKEKISTLDIIQAIPSEEIILDVDNLIMIITSWKKELLLQQNLTTKLNSLKKTKYDFKKGKTNNFKLELVKQNKKVYSSHRLEPLEIELWKSKITSPEKELIIFMPGLGGDIENFKWIGKELTNRGWPVIFLDHSGSNSDTFMEVLEGKEVIPGSADFFLYRLKDLDSVLKAHRNGNFGLANDSYILMGHSLGTFIALLYEGNKTINGLEKRCLSALKDLAVTNLSKLLQCQLSEIPLVEKYKYKKASAIIGFNAFGSLIWPKEKSSGIDVPILLIGGTYDLITPIIGEQFQVFLSSKNPLSRFLVIEGASHFSPIRINSNVEGNKDIFKISESFIGSNPISVQNLSLEVLVAFLNKLKKKEGLQIITNQRKFDLDFHILGRKNINQITRN